MLSEKVSLLNQDPKEPLASMAEDVVAPFREFMRSKKEWTRDDPVRTNPAIVRLDPETKHERLRTLIDEYNASE